MCPAVSPHCVRSLSLSLFWGGGRRVVVGFPQRSTDTGDKFGGDSAAVQDQLLDVQQAWTKGRVDVFAQKLGQAWPNHAKYDFHVGFGVPYYPHKGNYAIYWQFHECLRGVCVWRFCPVPQNPSPQVDPTSPSKTPQLCPHLS